MQPQRIDSIEEVECKEIRDYLENNSYDKVVDLEEHNFQIARYYRYQDNPRFNVYTYFEVDHDYTEFL